MQIQAGNHNAAHGLYALRYNTTGSNNTASGIYSLYNTTTGSNNTASGYYALKKATQQQVITPRWVDVLCLVTRRIVIPLLV